MAGKGNKPGNKTKYTKDTVRRMCAMIAHNDYSLMEVCKAVNIHHETYYRWLKDIPEFKAAIQDAHRLRFETYIKAAREGLLTLLKGKEWEEITTEYSTDRKGKEKMKSRKVVSKFVLPNVASVIFTLKTLDREHFEEIQKLANPDGSPIDNTIKLVHVSSPIPLANDEEDIKLLDYDK